MEKRMQHVTLVYFDADINEGRGHYQLVRAYTFDLRAKRWVEEQKDPFNRSNITWRQYDDGTRFYGAYRLDRIEVDDSPMTDEEVRAHEDRMIDEVLATLLPEQRAAIEARMHPTRP